jgi:hypothetical protein
VTVARAKLAELIHKKSIKTTSHRLPLGGGEHERNLTRGDSAAPVPDDAPGPTPATVMTPRLVLDSCSAKMPMP